MLIVCDLYFLGAEKQQQYQNGVKKLEMYLQGHSTLVEVTEERDLRQIGHMFIQTEQKNFAHINYINELHSRRNMLKSCTIKMKACAHPVNMLADVV